VTAQSLDVFLGLVLVGHLLREEGARTTFVMAESYRRMPRRPVLSQSFEDDLQRRYRSKPGKLPAFFANLLAEGVLREVVEAQNLLLGGDDFAFLSHVGGDLPGAVVVRPGEQVPTDTAPTTGEENEESAPAPDSSEDGMRFSLAGAQLKFSMIRDRGRFTLPGRDRTGQWIVKVASSRWNGLPENEHTVLEWARAAGFDVPEQHLVLADHLRGLPAGYLDSGSLAFAIRRYDREGQRRIHQEDLAQVAGLLPELKYRHYSYAQLGALMKAFGAFDEFVRRLALVIASGNADAHLKNWSLLYPDGIMARLSPLYDQVSTVAWPSIERRLALKVVHKKNFAQIDEAEMLALAHQCQEPPARVMDIVGHTLEQLAAAWRKGSESWPMLEEHRFSLYEHWQRVPLLRQHGFDKLGNRSIRDDHADRGGHNEVRGRGSRVRESSIARLRSATSAQRRRTSAL